MGDFKSPVHFDKFKISIFYMTVYKYIFLEATETKVEILKSESPAINFFILRK